MSKEMSSSNVGPRGSDRSELLLWLGLGLATFTVAAGLAYRPDLSSGRAVVMTVVPWLMLVGLVTVFLDALVDLSLSVRVGATAIAIGGWAIIVFDDWLWYLVVFALYAVCYSVYPGRPSVGIGLSALVSAIWAGALISAGAPAWTTIVPSAVFVVASVISLTTHRTERLNQEQADLIGKLRDTQRDLAASERSKGILEERARMASEIHDTLAQGFTSIVILSRAGQRSGGRADVLAAIEETAQENLDAARRLVDAIRPSQLETASLPDALQRHLSSAVPDDIRAELRVVGEPRRLTGAVEVTLLRAAQEALANVTAHAKAKQVDVTLSYLDDAVALDVRDDGVGFVPGQVSDRGSLTGGQGLDVLEQRTRSLAGQLTVEANEGGGSVLSVLLPAGSS